MNLLAGICMCKGLCGCVVATALELFMHVCDVYSCIVSSKKLVHINALILLSETSNLSLEVDCNRI